MMPGFKGSPRNIFETPKTFISHENNIYIKYDDLVLPIKLYVEEETKGFCAIPESAPFKIQDKFKNEEVAIIINEEGYFVELDWITSFYASVFQTEKDEDVFHSVRPLLIPNYERSISLNSASGVYVLSNADLGAITLFPLLMNIKTSGGTWRNVANGRTVKDERILNSIEKENDSLISDINKYIRTGKIPLPISLEILRYPILFPNPPIENSLTVQSSKISFSGFFSDKSLEHFYI